MPAKNHIILSHLTTLLVIILFVYTGSSKLLIREAFVNQLAQLPFLKNVAGILSVLLPVLEITTALLIAFVYTQIYGWWLASLLMTFFTIYVAGMLLSKISLPCSCGGVIASMSWQQHVVFNIFFMCLSWFGLYNSYQEKNQKNWYQ